MNMNISRLFTGVLAWIGLGAALFAQNAQLQDGLSALVRITDTVEPVLVALDNDGALLRSANGGVGFTTVRPADDPQALYTLAASGVTVIAMGDAGNFVRSTDAGLNWTDLASATTSAHDGPINGLAAHDSTWIAVGQSGDLISILRSTNAGASWSVAGAPAHFGTLYDATWTGSRWIAVGGDGFSGFIYTSTDGAVWSQLANTADELYAVASDGAGNVLIGGDAGTLFYASDGGATSTSFTSVGDNVVSEAIRAVAFLSGTNWIAGGDHAALVSYNGTVAAKVWEPSTTVSAPITALAATGTGTTYYYSEPASATPTPHGPISLTATQSGGQIQLTLVGAESGYSYYLESSTTLSSWDVVGGSTQAYDGTNAPTWSYPLPAAGQRVFYRAANVTP